MSNLRQMWGVAVVEWKLQTRTVVFWVGLAVLVLFGLGKVIGAPPEMAFLARQWIGGREDALIWLSIVLIFLIPSGLARDQRTAALIWTTRVSGGVYAAGKLLGLWLVTLTLSGLELATQIVIRAPAWPRLTAETLGMLLSPIMVWLIGIFYITSVYYFFTTIVKGHSPTAYFMNAIYFLASFSIKDPANPLGFIPFPLFSSDLVGYGPETQLINSHTLLYLTLMPVVSALALLIYPRRERRSPFPLVEQGVLATVLAIAIGMTFWAGTGYAEARAEVLAEQGYTTSELAAEAVQSVRVAAYFDPDQGYIEGDVSVTMAQFLPNLAFDIPRGLTVATATNCQGQVLQTMPVGLETLQISPDSLQICVSFSGNWRPDRSDYKQYGFLEDIYAGMYLGNGYVYMTPYTHWYPAPAGPYQWQVPHDVEIALPRRIMAVISSSDTINSDGEWINYDWVSEGGRPRISLIAGDYRLVSLLDETSVWVAPGHIQVAEITARFFLDHFETAGHLLHLDDAAYQIVETPVLRWPVIHEGFVFLPESYFTERLVDYDTTYERNARTYGEEEAFRQEAYHLVNGLLHGQVFFADPALAPSHNGTDLPTLSRDLSPYYTPLRESLAHYITLQLVDERFGTHYLSDVMTARMLYANRYIDDPAVREQYPFAVLPDLELVGPPYDRNWAFNQMFAALGRLERRVGRGEVDRMIEIFLKQHSGTAVLITDWLEIVEEISGREARDEFETTYRIQDS